MSLVNGICKMLAIIELYGVSVFTSKMEFGLETFRRDVHIIIYVKNVCK